MRTPEQQEKNIQTARAYAAYDVTQAIRASHYSEDDKETMIRIINATYSKDAMALYQNADTMVREALQDIIEETYYGKKSDQGQKCPVCGRFYTERPALSRKDGSTAICPDCGTKEALDAFTDSIIPKAWETGNSKHQRSETGMTIQEAVNTLDSVIPTPQDKTVDSAHLAIAIAWQKVKAELLEGATLQDKLNTLMKRRNDQIETIRCRIDAGTLTHDDRRLLDELNIPHEYDRRGKLEVTA